jgi:hypothetical protein
MQVGARLALIGVLMGVSIGCGNRTSGLFRQYEYEEEMYLSLDGTATVYVNSSIAALDALHGASFDASPTARVDRDAVGAFFTSFVTHLTRRVNTSRRNNRQFVHLRMDVDDVRRLGEARPFAWSTYRFTKDGHLFVYQQSVGATAGGGDSWKSSHWNGHEIVAFRLHVPSKILDHNAGRDNEKRGNILVWEQPLTDRLRGVPLQLEARMGDESILSRTLWLFGATFIAVAVAFALVIWWVFRRGAESAVV